MLALKEDIHTATCVTTSTGSPTLEQPKPVIFLLTDIALLTSGHAAIAKIMRMKWKLGNVTRKGKGEANKKNH